MEGVGAACPFLFDGSGPERGREGDFFGSPPLAAMYYPLTFWCCFLDFHPLAYLLEF